LQDQAVMVFGGTAARSSAIGTANFEEGMLTYLTDVDKLQVYTGASFVDVYPAAATNQGLTLINTTSFSGVTSISLAADTFTSTYTNYKIIISELFGATSGNGVSFRLRKAGVDNTTASSYRRRGYAAGASLALTAGDDTSYFLTIVNNGSTAPTSGFLDLFQPKKNNQTSIQATFYSADTENTYAGAGRHTVVDTFDSATFFSGVNLTGTVSVYGYNI
jgi:hypothetical protein